VPLEGRFLLIALHIVRIITLYVIVRQMPLSSGSIVTSINSDGVKLVYNKSNHNINTIIPGSVEHMTTGNNMIDIKSNIFQLLVSDIFLK
jgi:hypothetical protein